MAQDSEIAVPFLTSTPDLQVSPFEVNSDEERVDENQAVKRCIFARSQSTAKTYLSPRQLFIFDIFLHRNLDIFFTDLDNSRVLAESLMQAISISAPCANILAAAMIFDHVERKFLSNCVYADNFWTVFGTK